MLILLASLFLSTSTIASAEGLLTSTVSEYACLKEMNGDEVEKLHFYYNPRQAPHPLNSWSLFTCHDTSLYGPNDSVIIPRLDNKANVLKVFSSLDYRFYDNDGDGIRDIEQILADKIKSHGGSYSAYDGLFIPLEIQGDVEQNIEAGNEDSLEGLGWMLRPSVRNGRSYCDWNHLKGYMNAIEELTGTYFYEGVYVGESRVNGTLDYIILKESDLKKVWYFYDYETNSLQRPTDRNVANVTVYFNYPLNFEYPFVKNSDQKVYRLQGLTHDRRIGCVPRTF